MSSADDVSGGAISPSFVAGVSLPPNANGSDDAATLLQVARPDGYDFCVIPLPTFPANLAASNSKNTALLGVSVSPSLPRPRRDVTNMESKW